MPVFQRPTPVGALFLAISRLDFIRSQNVKTILTRLWKEETGQDLTEYALLLVLLSLAAIGSLNALAAAINGVFSSAVTNLT